MNGENFSVRPLEVRAIERRFRLRKSLWESSTDAEHKTEMRLVRLRKYLF